DVLRYWLTEYRFDGFRFDLVKGLGNNDSYASPSDASTNDYNQSRVDRMKRLHDVMRKVNPDAYFINENLAGAKEENAMAADGELNWANVNEAGCQFAMGYSTDSSLNRMWAVKDSRTAGSTVAYLESHDEQRLAYKQNMFGATGVKGNNDVSCRRLASAAAQMILVPGSHMIWQFSEMGNAENTKDSNGGNNTSPKTVNWALLDKPANAALKNCYSRLIDVRLNNPDLFASSANYTLNFSGWSGLRSASSFAGDKEIYLFVNPSVTASASATANFRSTDASAYRIVSQADGITPTIDYATKRVTLPPNSYVVIASKAVVGIDNILDDNIDSADSSLQAYSQDGTLYVTTTGAEQIHVYTPSGIKVATSRGNLQADLPAGLYIVTSAGHSIKALNH
ncbi:MAG: hypothetical protein K2G64_03365, partial [Muribaculaceae bacterium]|nr:hypothetical protein [Muribaculaceae bacterium]